MGSPWKLNAHELEQLQMSEVQKQTSQRVSLQYFRLHACQLGEALSQQSKPARSTTGSSYYHILFNYSNPQTCTEDLLRQAQIIVDTASWTNSKTRLQNVATTTGPSLLPLSSSPGRYWQCQMSGTDQPNITSTTACRNVRGTNP